MQDKKQEPEPCGSDCFMHLVGDTDRWWEIVDNQLKHWSFLEYM